MDTESIRTPAPAPAIAPVPRPQLTQLSNQRPQQNITNTGQPIITQNPNPNSAVRPPINNFQPLIGGQQQNIIRQPPPLRRIDSRQTIPGQLPLRPQGNINQQYNPQSFQRPPQQQQQLQQSQQPQLQSQQSQQQFQQQRPLNPNQTPNIYGQPIRGPSTNQQQQQYQQNRPQFYPSNPQQQQNLQNQNRPPIRPGAPLTNQINPNTATSQIQFRPQFAPQPRPIQPPIRQTYQPQVQHPQVLRNQPSLERIRSQQDLIPTGMASEIQKIKPDSPIQPSVTKEDDDDVIIGRAVTPAKTDFEEIKNKPQTPTSTETKPSIFDSPLTKTNEVKRVEFNMSPQSNEIDTNKQLPNTDRKNVISPNSVVNGTGPVDNVYRQIPDRQKTPSPDAIPSKLNLNLDQQKDFSVLKTKAVENNVSAPMSINNSFVKPIAPSIVNNTNYRPQSQNKNITDLAAAKVLTENDQPISLNSIINPEKSSGLTTKKSIEVKNTTSTKEEVKIANSRFDTKPESVPKTTNKNKGDNDSGVDETTQEKGRNGVVSPVASPLKSPSKIPGPRPPSSTKPSISRSTSKTRSLKSPDTPAEPIKKKIPMNKVQVGGAPSPNLKVIKSKIGSFENQSHKPGGGNVKIETKRVDIKASPRIENKNEKYMPGGGDRKITSTKLQWNAKPKIGSLDNASYKPGGGDKKIESLKTDFKDKAKSKVGSKENMKHLPGGGEFKIQTHKLDIKAQSKIGSLDNIKHRPGGGDKKIFDDKEYLKNVDHPITPTPPSQLWRTSTLTSSMSLPAECIVLSLTSPSSNRNIRKLTKSGSKSARDGRAWHPIPFKIY